jgi:lipopolysaccharide/colanic/teichoic acid biosynthesis glycosyltransferase
MDMLTALLFVMIVVLVVLVIAATFVYFRHQGPAFFRAFQRRGR